MKKAVCHHHTLAATVTVSVPSIAVEKTMLVQVQWNDEDNRPPLIRVREANRAILARAAMTSLSTTQTGVSTVQTSWAHGRSDAHWNAATLLLMTFFLTAAAICARNQTPWPPCHRYRRCIQWPYPGYPTGASTGLLISGQGNTAFLTVSGQTPCRMSGLIL
ncbi:hypothetical protein ACFO1V_01875 [Daeguia caeni]|uniref:Uncharacterized protein n=1 Tax=Daeguia caeni TaxID=439612 RepID=A0ABV9H3C8_9HYPH